VTKDTSLRGVQSATSPRIAQIIFETFADGGSVAIAVVSNGTLKALERDFLVVTPAPDKEAKVTIMQISPVANSEPTR
jgi:hypothetical protein